MCWKYEWAYAINRMQRAIKHVETARNKMIFRRERSSNPKIIEKYGKAEQECNAVIASLKEQQAKAFKMIHEYGISHTSKNHTPESLPRVYKLMGDYPLPEEVKQV